MLWHMREINFINLKKQTFAFAVGRVFFQLNSNPPFLWCPCCHLLYVTAEIQLNLFQLLLAGGKNKQCLEGPALTIMFWHGPLMTMMKLVLFLDTGCWILVLLVALVLCAFALTQMPFHFGGEVESLVFPRLARISLGLAFMVSTGFLLRPSAFPAAHLFASFSVAVVGIAILMPRLLKDPHLYTHPHPPSSKGSCIDSILWVTCRGQKL